MTSEIEFNIPAQLIINGETIDVMVKSVKKQENETPITHTRSYRDSNGTLFIDSYKVGRDIQTITTFECVKITDETFDFESSYNIVCIPYVFPCPEVPVINKCLLASCL